MAIVTTNVLINGLSGKLGRSLVFRTVHGKTFVNPAARKPDKKKETPAQRETRVNFSQASEWARTIMHNPEKKEYYRQRAKVLKLPNAYTAALTDFMRKPKIVKTQRGNTVTYRVNKSGFTLKDVTIAPDNITRVQPTIITRRQNETWVIEYSDDDIPLSVMLVITDNSGRAINFVDRSRYTDHT